MSEGASCYPGYTDYYSKDENIRDRRGSEELWHVAFSR